MKTVNVYSAVRSEFSPELCVVEYIVKKIKHGPQNVTLDVYLSRYMRPSHE